MTKDEKKEVTPAVQDKFFLCKFGTFYKPFCLSFYDLVIIFYKKERKNLVFKSMFLRETGSCDNITKGQRQGVELTPAVRIYYGPHLVTFYEDDILSFCVNSL